MFENIQETSAFIHEHQIRMVDLKYGDLWGRWRHLTISVREFSSELVSSGVGFNGSNAGFQSGHSEDMVLIPDLSSGFLVPFFETPTLSFIANVCEADTKSPYSGDPREILKRTQQYLFSHRIADESLWGPEFEFYIFDKVALENGMNVASYRVNASGADWQSGENEQGHSLPLAGGYHAIPPNDQFHNLRTHLSLLLEEAGVPVKYHHHESGGPGQNEIETPMLASLAAADSVMKVKYFTRMAAHQAGLTATFLPKPLFGAAGSGMHFHQQLRHNGRNVFFDPDGVYLLSQTALYYIGGLLTHAAAILAITNPSTNSYRRLVPGFSAPLNICYSSNLRGAAIRVLSYATQPDQVRFEFRPPDGACNPYLAISAQLLAGLDGIHRKIDPGEAGFGPVDEEQLTLVDEHKTQIKKLPISLEEAANALEKDHEFLLAGDTLSKSLIDQWIKVKREEDAAIRIRPHPYEIQRDFDL